MYNKRSFFLFYPRQTDVEESEETAMIFAQSALCIYMPIGVQEI